MTYRAQHWLLSHHNKRSRVHCADCNLTLSDLGETSSDEETLNNNLLQKGPALNENKKEIPVRKQAQLSKPEDFSATDSSSQEESSSDESVEEPEKDSLNESNGSLEYDDEKLVNESKADDSEKLVTAELNGESDSSCQEENSSDESIEESENVSLNEAQYSQESVDEITLNEIKSDDSQKQGIGELNDRPESFKAELKKPIIRLRRISNSIVEQFSSISCSDTGKDTFNQELENFSNFPKADYSRQVGNSLEELIEQEGKNSFLRRLGLHKFQKRIGDNSLNKSEIDNSQKFEGVVLENKSDSLNKIRLKTPIIKLRRLSNSICKKSVHTPTSSCDFENFYLRRKKKMSASDSESVKSLLEASDDNGVVELDIEKINSKVVELNKQMKKFSKKIKNLDISIEWELPDIHKLENGIWKSNAYDASKGRLSSEEIEYLNERLTAFLEEYNLDFESFKMISRKHVRKIPNDIRIKFIQYLSKDLTYRTPRSVYSYISRLGLRKGVFSEKEDKFLIEMYNNYTGPNLNSLCGLMLNRHRFNIYRRYQRLKAMNCIGSRPVANKSKSSVAEVRENVLNYMLHRSNKTGIKNYGKKFSNRMWAAVGNYSNTSPALAKGIFYCDIWPTMFAEHPIYYYSFCSKFITRLYADGFESWEDIQWRKLSRELNGVTSAFLYLLLRKITMQYVPSGKWKNFQGCIEYLYHKVLPIFEEKQKGEDYVMRKLELK